MPEGHTIHRAARLQNALLGGQALTARSPQGRFTDGAAQLDGRRLVRVEAHGKHLLYEFEDAIWLHVHLGLFGRIRTGTGSVPVPRGAVRLELSCTDGWAALSGPTVCEVIDGRARRRLVARIGPDPLRPGDRPRAPLPAFWPAPHRSALS